MHDSAVPVCFQLLILQQAEGLLSEFNIAGRRERLQRICLSPEPPWVFHESATETATDAGDVSDKPLRIDLHPVVDLLETLVGNASPRPVDADSVRGVNPS